MRKVREWQANMYIYSPYLSDGDADGFFRTSQWNKCTMCERAPPEINEKVTAIDIAFENCNALYIIEICNKCMPPSKEFVEAVRTAMRIYTSEFSESFDVEDYIRQIVNELI